MLQMPNIKFEKGRRINFQTALDDSLDIMDEIVGFVEFKRNVKYGKLESINSNYKQILVADILHALLAKDIQCDHFLTFDRGFESAKNIEKFQSLNIEIH